MTRRHESTSFRTSVIVIGFSILSLFIFITLSNFLAPEKPDAPVGSIITFESPPPLDALQFDFDAIPASYDAKDDEEDAELPKEIFHDENFAVVTGTITDIATGKPIANATIKAQWERSEEEVLAFNEYRESLRDENADDSDDTIDPEDLQDLEDILGADRFEDFEEFLNIDDLLLEPNSEHSDHQVAHSDVDGIYTIYVPYDRPVVLGFSAIGYVPVTREDLVFSPDEEYPPLDIALSRGASVAGRIYNIGTNEGIAGMFLDIDPDSAPNSYRAHVSDENGTYVISGLVPGQFDLKVEHRNTRFKPGKVLPFQRITIDHDFQEIRGVDFGLTRAGIVWGYTRAPQDDSPVQANLLLVGTENMITQGINAAMSEFQETQAVFATYSDTENDGYYELAGVPLDKEWRVFAMSNDRAPQLSDSFVLTASSPDIRVDINLLNGSDVYGRVVDEDGYPVQGAELFCMPGFTEFFAPLGSAKVFRNATSDGDGNFVLNDLPSGSYKIFSFKQGYKITARGVSIFPDGQFDITGIVVELHAATSGEHIIYGIVTDRDGQPVSGAELNMMGFSMDSILSDGDPGGENTTTTNQYGEYLYEGVSLGKYIININKEGFSPRTIAKVWLDKPTDIILGGGALISGTVYVRETDRPFDGSFTISANPEVALTFDRENPLQIFENITNQSGQTFTDTNGEFEIALNPGNYTLQASAEDYLRDSYPITVVEDEDIDDIILYISETGGSIEGRVRTADSSSPQGARVRLTRSLENLIGMLESIDSVQFQTVAQDGRFAFQNVPNGEFIVVASHPGYASSQSGPVIISNSDNISGVELILGTGGTLEGQVFSNGRPIPNTIVMILNAVSPISASTDDRGYYKIEGLNAGEHRIIAVSPFALNSDTLQSQLGELVIVETGRTTRKDLELSEVETP